MPAPSGNSLPALQPDDSSPDDGVLSTARTADQQILGQYFIPASARTTDQEIPLEIPTSARSDGHQTCGRDLNVLIMTYLTTLSQQLDAVTESQKSIVTGQADMHSAIAKMRAEAAHFMSRETTFESGISPEFAGKDQTLEFCQIEHIGDKLRRGTATITIQPPSTVQPSPRHVERNLDHALLFAHVTKRRRKKLIRTIQVNDQLQARAEAKKEAAAQKWEGGFWKRVQNLDRREFETFLDSVLSVIIALNSVSIGLSIDHNGGTASWNIWMVIDLCFTVIFGMELSFKIWLHGLKGHFCSLQSRFSNTFDAILIFLDFSQMAIQLVLEEMSKDMDDSGIPSASLFRVARLARLTRVIRLLRTEKFNDLLAMVHGMVAGSLTLFWAVVVFVLMVYVVALLCREVFGTRREPQVYEYFQDVPRSMYTVFRCSFGDCSSKDGFPIPEYIARAYGGGFGLAYCLFVFFITVGLFNIISAIFVDSTMSAAAALNAAKFQKRLLDEERWAESVSTILAELLAASPDHQINGNWLFHIDTLLNIEFTPGLLDDIITNTTIQKALSRLDIDSHDFHKLSDILDPDQSGAIGVLELIDGLDRLRGSPRRSDVVTVDLMVRNVQDMVDEILTRIVRMQGS